LASAFRCTRSRRANLERRRAELADSIPEETAEVYLPAIVLAELWIGIELASGPEVKRKRTQRIRELLEGTTVIPFTEEIAPTYTALYALLCRKGVRVL